MLTKYVLVVNELGNFSTYYHAAEKHLCVILQSFFAIPFSFFRMPNLGMLNVNRCEARNCFPRLLITRNMSLNSLACLGRSRLLFLTLRLFLEQLRQQTRHIRPRAGWRGIFFIALCTHLPENSFAVAKMERRTLFSTRTQFLTRK